MTVCFNNVAMKKNLTKGVIFSLISAISFSTLAILIKIGYDSKLDTLQMLLFRFFFATLLMGLFLGFTEPHILKPNTKLLLKAFFAGTILYPSQAFCFFRSIKYTSPNVVELILYLYPATVTILSHFVFREKINFYESLFITIILLGFLFIFHDAFEHKLKLLGIILATLAMIIYTFYLIFIQLLLKNENPITLSFYTIFFSFLSFSVISIHNLSLPSNLGQFTVEVLLGLIPTFFAIMFLFMAIDQIGSALVSVFSSIEPVFTILLAYLLLSISLNKFQFIGGMLIITGVTMTNIYHAGEGKQ